MNPYTPRGPRTSALQRTALAPVLSLALAASAAQPPQTAEPPKAPPAKPAPYAQEIPVAAYKIDMLPIPGSADGKIKPFYMSRTELGWEAFDVYIYKLDEEAGKGPKKPDAVSRPTKPYLPPDRGFGHEGYAAISMSYKNADEFCKWLSVQTGRTYRLATEAEWEHAARAGAPPDKPTQGILPGGAKLDDCAWFEANADDAPHPVGKKKPNAWGLCDMLGNVAEWVTGADGKPTTKGGCYQDAADQLTVTARQPQTSSWNSSDPQVPKSKWWLSDGPFVGFRIVCEAPLPAGAAAKSPADQAQPSSPAPSTKPTPSPATPPTPEKKP